MSEKMSKGKTVNNCLLALVRLLNAANTSANNGVELEAVRGRDKDDYEAFLNYLMTTTKEGGFIAKYKHWLTLDAEHEYEIAERERVARLQANKAVECVL